MTAAPRPTVSAILITRNEAHNLPECLAGLAWVDEVILVDHGSDDGTAALARRLGAKVTTTADWPGFGPQKNRALELAQGQWVLSGTTSKNRPDAGMMLPVSGA